MESAEFHRKQARILAKHEHGVSRHRLDSIEATRQALTTAFDATIAQDVIDSLLAMAAEAELTPEQRHSLLAPYAARVASLGEPRVHLLPPLPDAAHG